MCTHVPGGLGKTWPTIEASKHRRYARRIGRYTHRYSRLSAMNTTEYSTSAVIQNHRYYRMSTSTLSRPRSFVLSLDEANKCFWRSCSSFSHRSIHLCKGWKGAQRYTLGECWIIPQKRGRFRLKFRRTALLNHVSKCDTWPTGQNTTAKRSYVGSTSWPWFHTQRAITGVNGVLFAVRFAT